MGFLGDLAKEIIDVGKSEIKTEVRSGTREAIQGAVKGAKNAIKGENKEGEQPANPAVISEAASGATSETSAPHVQAQPVTMMQPEAIAQPEATAQTEGVVQPAMNTSLETISKIQSVGNQAIDSMKTLDEEARRNAASSSSPEELVQKTLESAEQSEIGQKISNLRTEDIDKMEKNVENTIVGTTKGINAEATAAAGADAITLEQAEKFIREAIPEDQQGEMGNLADNPFLNGTLAAINLGKAEKNGVDLKAMANGGGVPAPTDESGALSVDDGGGAMPADNNGSLPADESGKTRAN